MLKKILSISGRPGLYRLVSQGKNMIIVEQLGSSRRLPVYGRDKIVSLGDISIYTADGEDTPLYNVLETLRQQNEGAQVDINALGDLRQAFAKVLPDFDSERVYTTDIKKVYQWYNLLVNSGFTSFLPEQAEEQAAEGDDAEASAAE